MDHCEECDPSFDCWASPEKCRKLLTLEKLKRVRTCDDLGLVITEHWERRKGLKLRELSDGDGVIVADLLAADREAEVSRFIESFNAKGKAK